MATTADVKFTIADIASVLTSTPPAKITTSTVSATPISDAIDDVVINIGEFTTDVHREIGQDELLVVLGSGIFDKIMETVTEHLAVQYANGRIRGEDYATAYIQLLQAALQTAMSIWLQKGINEKQIAIQVATTNAQLKLQADTSNAQLKLQADTLKSQGDLQWAIALLQRDTQEALIDAQVQAEEAKKNLYRRQIEGFDEDYKQKILKICMDSWAVGFSVARDSFEASGIPAPMQKVTIDSLYNQYVVTELDKYNYSRPI